MVAFATVERNLISELENHIESIVPDVNRSKVFRKLQTGLQDLSSIDEGIIGPREFVISPGRMIAPSEFGKAYRFPIYEYDITFQYPSDEDWARIMHSDIALIRYKLLNTPTSVSGVAAKFIKPDLPVETIDDESEDYRYFTMTLSVYYETTDTA